MLLETIRHDANTVCLCLAAAIGLAAAGLGYAHEAAHYSAGEPGNPKKPARVVLVIMREGDGRMMFIPDKVEVRRGEQIRFVLTNTGSGPAMAQKKEGRIETARVDVPGAGLP